jgi:carbamoyl-phosphate synthase small subunit
MTGYQEIFTDPSYYGQIMVATNAHSNYGVNENEVESDGIKISGWYVKFSFNHSRADSSESLEDYLSSKILFVFQM